MTASKEGNCVNEDCIPFSDIVSSTNRESDSFEDAMDKGNGRTPRVWTSARRYTVWWGRSAKFWLTVFLIVLFITFLLFVIFLTLWIHQNNILKNAPCLTAACLKTASAILSSMDPTVSPCDNFYQYACSGWLKEHQILPGENQISVLRLVSKRTDYFMRDLLENQSIPNPSPGLVAAQTFYRSCMNESLRDKRGFDPLFTSIKQLYGGWTLLPKGAPASRPENDQFLTPEHFNLTELYLKQLRIFGATPLFVIAIGQDIKNSSNFVVELNQGSLGIQPENYLNETAPIHEKQTSAYKNFMRNYASLLGVPADRLDELKEVYALEKKLAENTVDRSERDPERFYVLTTLSKLREICPLFEWEGLFNHLYQPLNYTLSDNQEFALSEAEFFKARCRIYMEYMKTERGIRVLHNLAVWQFIWLTRAHMPSDVNRLQKEYIEAEHGLKIDQERWFTCQTETASIFGSVLGLIFAREKFDKKSDLAASKMIEEIREAFKENFATVTWMKEEDKVKALEKVEAMGASVGYPRNGNHTADELLFMSFMKTPTDSTYFENALWGTEANSIRELNKLILRDQERWELHPQVVNAFYKETNNHIYFPAGILQPPIYDSAHPLSINFGGIGMVVGHEITHAFDHQGAKRDAKGNLRQWWSNETREAFREKSQCMIEQYSNYSIYNTSLNGKMTLGENIADNGGLKASYRAFKKLEAKYSDGPVLPGIEFTPDQLFFLSFAQLWCLKAVPRSVLNTVLYDTHTIDQYRVIGTLMNSEDFARVYNCPVGSHMNPERKCIVW